MGFPFAGIRLPKPIRILLNLLDQIKFMSTAALAHLGRLLNPLEQDYSLLHPSSYILTMDQPSSPSLVAVPIPMCKASIKKRLPVVSYRNFLERRGIKEDEDEVATCAICLNGFKKYHRVRELSNCCHVFHRQCLDRWVDKCQLTCPLCRSQLLPAKEY